MENKDFFKFMEKIYKITKEIGLEEDEKTTDGINNNDEEIDSITIDDSHIFINKRYMFEELDKMLFENKKYTEKIKKIMAMKTLNSFKIYKKRIYFKDFYTKNSLDIIHLEIERLKSIIFFKEEEEHEKKWEILIEIENPIIKDNIFIEKLDDHMLRRIIEKFNIFIFFISEKIFVSKIFETDKQNREQLIFHIKIFLLKEEIEFEDKLEKFIKFLNKKEIDYYKEIKNKNFEY